MAKSKKLIIAVVVVFLAVLGFNIFTFLSSTVSSDKISTEIGSTATYTQIIDGADYGCDTHKYKIKTTPTGQSYLNIYHKAPFGIIESTDRYYTPSDSYLLNDEICYSFSAMNNKYTEYSYAFFGNNVQQAALFEISIDNVGTISREIDSANPFVCVFTDSDFNSYESVVHLEKTVKLIDSNGNTVLEQVI